MRSTQCEFMMWKGLPVIRKEIAKSMINNHDLTQKQTAELLGITPAAVCQYISQKRGNGFAIDQEFQQEIEKSAKKIIKDGNGCFTSETCRICKLLKSNGFFDNYIITD